MLIYSNQIGAAGTANTGGGAGGSCLGFSVAGSAGGSGIVVLRYKTDEGNAAATGGTKSTSGAYTIHSFTSSGTFVA